MGSCAGNEMRCPAQSAAKAWPAICSSLLLVAHALQHRAAGTCTTAAGICTTAVGRYTTAAVWAVLCSCRQHMLQELLSRAQGGSPGLPCSGTWGWDALAVHIFSSNLGAGFAKSLSSKNMTVFLIILKFFLRLIAMLFMMLLV